MRVCRSWQKRPCRSTKKFSWPTISMRLFAFITSRDTRGKPSGSSFLADRNDETGVMLRKLPGELAAEDKTRSFCGDMNCGGIEEAEVPRGGVLAEMAVVGRDRVWEAALSRSSTLSASATMRLAISSNAWIILTMALVALRSSRPAIAIKAYVRLAPRDGVPSDRISKLDRPRRLVARQDLGGQGTDAHASQL
jgi:hypothetical protein